MQNIIAVEDEQKIKEGIGKPEVIPVSSSASSRGPETGFGEVNERGSGRIVVQPDVEKVGVPPVRHWRLARSLAPCLG